MELKFRCLTASEVEARIGRGDELSAPILLYKDARVDQRILDETVGPMGWQKRYANGNTNCIISIWDKDNSQWVEKEDVGLCSGPDMRKGTASDSFKRACVCWGIGRELYTAPKLLVPISVLANYRVEKDGAYCDNTFCVTTLKCTDDHVITDVGIDVLYGDNVVYTVEFHSTDEGTVDTKSTAPTTTPTVTTPVTTALQEKEQPTSGTSKSEITEADVAVMYAKAELAGSSEKGVKDWIVKQFKITDVFALSLEQYQYVCRKLDDQAQKKKIA